MEEIISKEVAEKVMKNKGEARGISIKAKMEFALQKRGKKWLSQLEEEMTKVGYPLKYKKIKTLSYYPIGYETLALLLLEGTMNLTEKEISEVGEFVAKNNVIIRTFMKYLSSMELTVKNAPKMWKQYYTIGDLKVPEYNRDENYAIIRLENYHLHPIHCPFFKGYFKGTVQMVVKKETICEETKCIYRGDDYHEFLLKW